MKKILLLFAAILLIAGSILTFLFILPKHTSKGALQVTATPKSQVFLNKTLIGETPLCKCDLPEMIPVGEYTIKLVPKQEGLSSFEEKINITKSVLTVVDRTFGVGATGEGSSITLDPLTQKEETELLVLSFPDKTEVFLDSNPEGVTPLRLTDVTESDHEITVKKAGYREKSIRIHAVAGYRLTAIVHLGIDITSPTPTPATLQASVSASLSVAKVVILETPTGFLRVRDSNSLLGEEIARVSPGEEFPLLDEQQGWYRILLPSGKEGWISAQYAKRQ